MLIALINKTPNEIGVDNIVDEIFEADSVEDIVGLYDPKVYDLKDDIVQEYDAKVFFDEPDPKVKGLYCEHGMRWDPELERFHQWLPPGDGWTMTLDKYWKPPIDPEDGYIFPPIHPIGLKSRRWLWIEFEHRWVKKKDQYMRESLELFGEFNK